MSVTDYKQFLSGDVLSRYEKSLQKIENRYKDAMIRIDKIGSFSSESENKLFFVIKKYLTISNILSSVLKQLPVAVIAVDIHGNIIELTNHAKKEASGSLTEDIAESYNAYSWDKVWDVYDVSGNLVSLEDYPVIRALDRQEEVEPSVYKSIAKDSGEITYHNIWAEPIMSGKEQLGACVYIQVVKGFE